MLTVMAVDAHLQFNFRERGEFVIWESVQLILKAPRTASASLHPQLSHHMLGAAQFGFQNR